MIVGKIWDSEYPWDVRVEKVCRALTDAGHQVELVCRNRRREALIEKREGIRIHRMPVLKGLPDGLERASSFPAFVNPRWLGHTVRAFRASGADVILCRDLPLAPMALAASRRLQVPVVIDVAEHYPGLLKDLYNRRDFRLANPLVRNPFLARIVERLTLPRAHGVWVVVDEMATRLVSLGVAADRITLVSNTPTAERVARLGGRARPPRRSDELRLVYLGNVERSRGLGVVIEAMRLMHDDALRVTLDVFGDGTGLGHERRRVEELSLAERVTFHGRQPYDLVLDRLGDFDAGVIPHHATDHWNYTIQNKFFDYMAAGLPVVSSAMSPATRLTSETGAGVVFADRDPAALRDALIGLGDPVVRERIGHAGRAAVSARFNWDLDAARLVESLERLTGAVGRRPSPEPAGAVP